jgi:hypothetical protein
MMYSKGRLIQSMLLWQRNRTVVSTIQTHPPAALAFNVAREA